MMTNDERETLRNLIEGVFTECNKDYTDQMVEDALGKIEKMCKETAKTVYTYQHSDYSKMVKPVPEILKPLVDNDDFTDDVPAFDDILDGCSLLDRSELAEGINSLVYFWLDKWHQANESDDIWTYPLHLALMFIERFELRECLPVLLETERQNRDFAVAFFDSCDMVGMVPACIYQIATVEDLPILTDFVRERGIHFFSKAEVIGAVSTLPRRLPQALPDVQKWLCELLEIFADHIDPEVGDILLLEAIIHCCIHTRCEAAKPMIIRMYSKYKMPNLLIPGGVNEVRKSIKRASIGVLREDLESAEAIYQNADDDFYDDDDDFNDDDDDFDDYEEMNDEDTGDEETDYDDEELAPRQSYCGSTWGGKAQYLPVNVLKKYTLRIELKRSDPLVWRELMVPSSLSLPSLAQAILLAMGWDEDHLHQFITDKARHYATSQHELSEPLYMGVRDGSRYSISHLLKKSGDSVTFEYDYGDSWYHQVTLRDVSLYDSDEPKSVVLTDGANACPPDDCGGIHRYRDLVELIHEKPNSAELYRFYDWLGCKWDPEFFPKEEAAKAVEQMNP